MSNAEQADEGPVTVVVSRLVKPGCEKAFEEWMSGVCGAALQFEGHLGANVLRPADHAHPEYVLIFRFDSYKNLRKWEESPVRAMWLERVRDLTQGDPRVETVTGLEYWFTLSGAPSAPPPSRHKMALVTFLAIYPLVLAISTLLGPVLSTLPLVLRALVMAMVLVPLMTYVVMPQMTRLFAGWLYKQ